MMTVSLPKRFQLANLVEDSKEGRYQKNEEGCGPSFSVLKERTLSESENTKDGGGDEGNLHHYHTSSLRRIHRQKASENGAVWSTGNLGAAPLSLG
jgi:hypothetical protein